MRFVATIHQTNWNTNSTVGNSICRLFFGFVMVAMILLLVSESLTAQDWPHWRGPDRNDISKETGLLKSWPEDGPKRIWMNKTSGLGYAGFAIVGDRLYTMGLEENQEFALCLDAETGKEIWRTPTAKKFANRWGDGPRSTPTVDGDAVYFMFASGELARLKAKDGKQAWSVNMSDFGGKVPIWGYAESPLVDGDKVICTPGGPKGAVVALDKTSGKKMWQSSFKIVAEGRNGPDDRAHYSTVLPISANGKKLYVQLVPNAVVALDAKNGNTVWQSDWNGRIAVIPSPIAIGNKIYVCSGYNAGAKLIEFDAQNKVKEVWRNVAMKNHHGSVVHLDSHLYGYSDGAGFICQKLSDGKMIQNNKSDIKKGAVSYADGLFYFVEEQRGNVLLIDANPEGIKVVSKFRIDPQTKRRSSSGKIWVHPVVSDGKLYLRDQEMIYCYDIKDKEEKK